VLWDNSKKANSHITGVSEGEERDNGTEKLFEEILAKCSPNLVKDIHLQIQGTEQVSDSIIPERFMSNYIIIKHLKTKDLDDILKAVTKKPDVIYKVQ
jgi:hypothetical protein